MLAKLTWSADVLAHSGDIAEALSEVLHGPVVIEVRDAPLYRDVLQAGCLAPDGFPVLVCEASYKAFGVKLAGVPGEPDFLDYVPRDADQELDDGLRAALAGRRMLLVVGGSAGGKSRSAAEAARLRLPGYRLVARGRRRWHGCRSFRQPTSGPRWCGLMTSSATTRGRSGTPSIGCCARGLL